MRETSTGIGVVKREEADPRFLEPLLSLVGDPEPISSRPELRIKYVIPAAANPEYIKLRPGITVFCPMRARWYCGSEFFRSLVEMEKPEKVDVNLILYDNSRDLTFGKLCKRFLAGVGGYSSVSYVEDQRTFKGGKKPTVDAVAHIYGRMAHLVDTEYVLTLEDDVVMRNKGILVELYDSLTNSKKLAAAGANVIERNDKRTMCWYFRGEIPLIKWGVKESFIQEVDGISFSCTLWKTRLLKAAAFKPKREHPQSFYATDITLCANLWEKGFSFLMHWDLHCSHVEPRRLLYPMRITPFYEEEDRKPERREDVFESVSKLIEFPVWQPRKTLISSLVSRFRKEKLVESVKGGVKVEVLLKERSIPLTYYGDQISLGKDYPLDVSIGVACIDHPDLTKAAIDSLLETTEHLDREIMVWDNASTDPKTWEMLDSYSENPYVEVFKSPVNRGYIYPMNFMAKRSKGKFFVVSNNDIVAHGGWFEALKEPFVNPLVAQTGPLPEYGHLNDKCEGGPGELDYLEGFFFVVPRWVLDRYPLFDEEHLTFATCEDADLSLRLKEVGFKIVAVPEAKIEHFRSKTRLNDRNVCKIMDKTEEVNKKYMLQRWSDYLRDRSFPEHSVLVKRKGANGDLLISEGVLKGFKWMYPNSRLILITECVNIMRECPWTDSVRSTPEPGVTYSRVCDLDWAYESDLGQSRPKILSKKAGVPYIRPGFWVTDQAFDRISRRFEGKGPIITLHPTASWVNRCWPMDRWSQLSKMLSKDYHVVSVGGSLDEKLEEGESFYNRPWQEVAALMKLSKVVVCTDTVALHIGIGVETPTICLFGPTKPELVCDSPYMYSIQTKGLECIGCHHKPPFPKTMSSCGQFSHFCLLNITVDEVYQKTVEVLNGV